MAKQRSQLNRPAQDAHKANLKFNLEKDPLHVDGFDAEPGAWSRLFSGLNQMIVDRDSFSSMVVLIAVLVLGIAVVVTWQVYGIVSEFAHSVGR